MEIEDSNSILIMKDAPMYVMETTQNLPLQLFWWEGKISTNDIFATHFEPKTIEQIQNPTRLDELFDMEEIEKDDDVNVTFDLYFYKKGE